MIIGFVLRRVKDKKYFRYKNQQHKQSVWHFELDKATVFQRFGTAEQEQHRIKARHRTEIKTLKAYVD